MSKDTLMVFSYLTGAVLYVAYLLITKRTTKGKKLKKLAIQKGYTTKASLETFQDLSLNSMEWHGTENGDIRRRYKAVYKYVVNGQEYTYKITLEGRPDNEIQLYYPDGNPQKVFTDGGEPTDPISIIELVIVFAGIQFLYKTLQSIFL